MSRTHHMYARGDLVVVVDCADLERAARFWASALGYVSEGRADGASYRSLLPADNLGIEVLLQRTDDAKHGKNRVHLDLRTRDLEAEVGRVTALGATVLTSSPIAEHGWTWHVLADPDGNEFCVLQPPAAYWPDSSSELPGSGFDSRPDDTGAGGDLPADTRREMVAELCAVLDVALHPVLPGAGDAFVADRPARSSVSRRSLVPGWAG